jgi:hypothetical protein
VPAVFSQFSLPLQNDGTLTIALQPPNPISGWQIQCDLLQNFGGNPIYSAYVSSGFNNVSGINVIDGINGVFTITFPSLILSGFQEGNYPFDAYRLSGGVRMTDLAFGFRCAQLN